MSGEGVQHAAPWQSQTLTQCAASALTATGPTACLQAVN